MSSSISCLYGLGSYPGMRLGLGFKASHSGTMHINNEWDLSRCPGICQAFTSKLGLQLIASALVAGLPRHIRGQQHGAWDFWRAEEARDHR